MKHVSKTESIGVEMKRTKRAQNDRTLTITLKLNKWRTLKNQQPQQYIDTESKQLKAPKGDKFSPIA